MKKLPVTPGLRSSRICLWFLCGAACFLSDPLKPTLTAQVSQVASARGAVSGRVRNTVTGQYLNNARVAVKGTEIVAFTDQFGSYTLVNLPSGPAVIEVFYTDLDRAEISVQVPPGGVLEQNVELTSSARYGSDPSVVKLDAFLVHNNKESDAQALATNEQRFAPNIKNVLSADSVGDVLGSSVGDFLKFVPGLVGEFAAGEIVGISVRGIGGGMTSFSANGGVPKVSPFFAGGRDYHMINLSLNDISRIEITKVPTPSQAADSLAGSIDLISKSAFERSAAALRYSVNVAANSKALNFSREARIRGHKRSYEIYPVVDFDYTLPLGKSFGIVLTGMLSDRYYPTSRVSSTFNTGGTGTGATLERPYLQTVQLAETQRVQSRNTLSLKADWKVTTHSVLSFTNQYNYYDNDSGGLTMTPTVGTTGTSSVANGALMSFGENFTRGATGRGGLTMVTSESTWIGYGNTSDLNYRFDDGRWKVTAGVSLSRSTVDFLPLRSGYFGSLTASINRPVRAEFLDFDTEGPRAIRIFDNTNAAVDPFDIANYRITSAAYSRQTTAAAVKAANVNVRRALGFLPVPASVQVGASRRVQTQDIVRESSNWTFNGPDGNPNTAESAAPFVATNGALPTALFTSLGAGQLPWTSTTVAYELGKLNPGWFTQTLPQKVAEETYRRTQSEFVEEAVNAVYVQAETRLLHSRLRILTGVRFEQTDNSGQGALSNPDGVYAKNANGTYVRDAQGQRVRSPGAGAPGSLEELDFILQERASRSSRTYDGYYPSAHATYNITSNFLARLAYAKTYGRPSFNDVIPRTTISRLLTDDPEDDNPENVRGTLTVRNPALRPWTADNYDLSLEYYTERGGMFSGGVFRKDIANFFGDSTRIATVADLQEIGFDERYVGWTLQTKFNAGAARISGLELGARQSLRGLGPWGQYFNVFANGTKLRLEGHQQASFTSFVPKSANAGISFARKRLSLGAKWNYRGKDKRVGRPQFGPDGYQYIKSRLSLDLDAQYQWTRRLSLVASVNNALNAPLTYLDYGAATPGYARESRFDDTGIALAVGIKGTF
jgi:iron complex outermembrane recepter protein